MTTYKELIPRRIPQVMKGIVVGCAMFASISAWAGGIAATAYNKAGEAMSDVVVYAIAQDVHSTALRKTEPATIAQDHLQFTPYVTPVRLGSEIRFPNYDKVEHHVKSFSAAKEFEIKPYEKTTPPPVLFDKPGVVVIYCLIHEWMRAYVYVVETPFFGKSEANGQVTLESLPPGNYQVLAWHPDMGTIKAPLQQRVKITAEGVEQVKFDFDFIPKKRKPAKAG
ncbi:MAG TPA: methylamine utilization protein [Burkholderiaceae bacterium]|jgi:plastocyanin